MSDLPLGVKGPAGCRPIGLEAGAGMGGSSPARPGGQVTPQGLRGRRPAAGPVSQGLGSAFRHTAAFGKRVRLRKPLPGTPPPHPIPMACANWAVTPCAHRACACCPAPRIVAVPRPALRPHVPPLPRSCSLGSSKTSSLGRWRPSVLLQGHHVPASSSQRLAHRGRSGPHRGRPRDPTYAIGFSGAAPFASGN